MSAVRPYSRAKKGKLLGGGQAGFEGVVMTEPADQVAALLGIDGFGAVLRDHDPARDRREKPGEHAQERGLARAIGPFQRERLAGAQLEGKPFEQAARAARDGKPLGGEGRNHARLLQAELRVVEGGLPDAIAKIIQVKRDRKGLHLCPDRCVSKRNFGLLVIWGKRAVRFFSLIRIGDGIVVRDRLYNCSDGFPAIRTLAPVNDIPNH